MPWYLDQLGSKGAVDIRWDDSQQHPEKFDRYDLVPATDQEPIRMRLHRERKALPDYFTGPTTRFLVVSKPFKDLVERFEPGVHHFIPTEIAQPNGTVWRDTHFLFKNGGLVDDGIIVDESDIVVRIKNTPNGQRRSYLPKGQAPRLMWAASRVRNRHLWADSMLPDANIVSDGLYAEIKAAGMKDFQAIESRISASR